MRRAAYSAIGLLLIASALVCGRELWVKRDLLVLAAVSPAIVAAAAYGLLLLMRSLRPAADGPGREPTAESRKPK